jgi:hypothetical protein
MEIQNSDPIINSINNGIKRGIQVAFDNKCFGSTVILLYSGIDVMAYINMPAKQEDVTRNDFIDWSDKYIKFSCKEQLTGKDLYGARCAMLHNYSVFSRMSRNSECRTIGYMDHSIPEVIFNPSVSNSLVLVSIKALVEAFSNGIDKYLVDLFSDNNKKVLAEERLKNLVHTFPLNK